MALFKILKGQEKNLPVTKTEGWAYVTTDEGNMYVDVSASKRVRIGAHADTATNADMLDGYHASGVYKAATYGILNPNSATNDWLRIATIIINGSSLSMGGFTAIFSNRECLDSSSFILTVAIRRNNTTSVSCQAYVTPIGTSAPREILVRSNDGVNFYVYFKSALNSYTTYYNVTKIMSENNVTFEQVGLPASNLIAGSVLNVTASRGGYVYCAQNADKWTNARTFITALNSESSASVDGSNNVTMGVSGTLPTGHGGTGNTAFTALRATYAETATKLSSSGHYMSSNKLAINSTSEPGYQFYVNGNTYLNGNTYSTGPLFIGSDVNGYGKNYIAFYGTTGDNPGSYNHTYIGENLWGSSESSELVLFKGNDQGSNDNAIAVNGAGPDRIRHIAAGHVFQIYRSALSGTFDSICASTVPSTVVEMNGSGLMISGLNSTSFTPNGTSTSVTVNRSLLTIYGQTYGNTAGQLKSNTAGVMSYGDGGPQIDFSASRTGGQRGAIIFTDHDSAGAGASWHFVSTEGDWSVNSKRFVAKSSITIGQNLQNSDYNLYVNGTSYFNGNTTHNGVDYFANGTSYYINNNADAKLRYLALGGLDPTSSYQLYVNGTSWIKGNLWTRHLYPEANNTYDLGSTSYKWKNVYATTFVGDLSGSADQLDGWHKQEILGTYTVTSNTANLSHYWCKLWSATITAQQYNDTGITIYVQSQYNGKYGMFSWELRQNGVNNSNAYNFTAALFEHFGNIPSSDIRLYYDNSTGVCEVWVNCWSQYGVWNYSVLKKNYRTTADSTAIGTFYTTYFSTAQTLPTSSYITASYTAFLGTASNADKLDGYHHDAFVKKAGDTMTGNLTVPKVIGNLQGNADTATTCNYPKGFSGRGSGGWGLQTGTSITDWSDDAGGDIDFRKNCPSAGQTSIKVDGRFYQNEGQYMCLDTNNFSGYALPLSGGTVNGTLRFSGYNGIYTRHIDGENVSYGGDLYLNYGVNAPIHVGNGGSYTISADGSYYSGSCAGASRVNYLRDINGNSHAQALQNEFNNYKSSIPRNCLINYYSSAYGNGSQYMGYFLNGYDSSPYGGFFVAHYTTPYYVGIAGGGFYQSQIWKSGDSVTGAVWNDYAECREADTIEPGYVLIETGNDSLTKSTERLSPFAGVSSDTWGFSQGETDKAKTPIAVAGRVLVYPWQDRNNYKPGDCVCAAPEGKVDIMTREEIIQYPDRIVGTVSSVPTYDKWGGGENADRDPVNVNGRIWIKVR